MNVLAFAPDAQPALADDGVVAPQEKVHVAPEMRQLTAVVKPDRARADDGNAEIWKRVPRSHRKKLTAEDAKDAEKRQI